MVNVTTTSPFGNVTNDSLDVPGVFERYTFTEFFGIFCPVALAVDRYVTPIWYAIGVFGNAMSAKIWTEKRMRSNNSSAIYLATLSVTDMVFLLLHTMQELKYAWGLKTLSYPVVCEMYFVFNLSAQYLSPLLVLGFTVERYIAVCHPFKKEKFCTTSRAIRVVVLLIFISLSLCSMQAYLWTYDSKSKSCLVRPEAMAGGEASLWSIWTWSTEMLIFLLVPVVILTFNVLVIKEVRKLSNTGQYNLPGQVKNAKGSSRATTFMLLSVSFYVIFTTLPATVVYALYSNFHEGTLTLTDSQIFLDPVWSRYRAYITVRKIVEEICLSHYACNVFLYLITGEHFRKCFMDTLRRKSYIWVIPNYSATFQLVVQ